QDQLQVCSRCQQTAAVASRTTAGDPVCAGCFRQDPANHEQCASCGRTAVTVRRDDGQAWCRRCYRAPVATCSVCGRDKACHLTPAGTRRCEHCSRRMRHVPCGRCGRDRAVWTRTADGQPLCGSCSRQRVPCSACGSTRTIAARIPEGPLCSTCYRKHPASFQPCTECGTTEHLYHHGLCTRCASRQHLLSLLADGQGGLQPHAEAICQFLAAGEPAWLMEWLTSGTAARNILAEISQASQPPSHADLDRHLPSRAATTCARSWWPAGSCLIVTSASPDSNDGRSRQPARSRIPLNGGSSAVSSPGTTCAACAGSRAGSTSPPSSPITCTTRSAPRSS